MENTNYEFFDRYFILTIGDLETKDQYIYKSTGTPIKMSFSINLTRLAQANSCVVSIWNLGEKPLKSLETRHCSILLEAGYALHKSTIFRGYVFFATTSKDGGDFKTDIEAYDVAFAEDGNAEEATKTYGSFNTLVSVNYESEVTWGKIFSDLSYLTSVAIDDQTNGLIDNQTVRRGFAYVGTMDTILDQGCRSCRANWNVQNGIVVLTPKEINPADSSRAFVLSAKTGLLGFPKRVKLENYTMDGMLNYGWDVEYLLNPDIKIGDTVFLDSKMASGYFTATMIGMTGDNYGDNWKCTARLLRRSHEGGGRSLYGDDDGNGDIQFGVADRFGKLWNVMDWGVL